MPLHEPIHGSSEVAGPVAVVSGVVPPMPSGNSVMLWRLFNDVSPETCVVVTPFDCLPLSDGGYPCPPLPVPYRSFCGSGLAVRDPAWCAIPGLRLLRAATRLWRWPRKLAAVLREERCSAVFACTGDLLTLPVACLAARSLGIPVVVHAFDDYARQWRHPAAALVARLLGRLVYRIAAAASAPNEFLCQQLQGRYGLVPTVLRNPAPAGLRCRPLTWPDPGSTVRIVFAGAIYEVHYRPLRTLCEALARQPQEQVRFELHLYSSAPEADLRRHGIAGPFVLHPAVPLSAMDGVLDAAHVLFLPLAADAGLREVVLTAAPGKLGDYLAAGRPIAACVPEASYIHDLLVRTRAGYLIPEDDPAAALRVLHDIDHGHVARADRLARARALAVDEFGVQRARRTLWKLLEGVGGRRRPANTADGGCATAPELTS